jgi:ABC-type histidine transport system ATPase subunit
MESQIDVMTVQVTDQFRLAERLLQKVGMSTKRAGGQQATIGANIQRRYVRTVAVVPTIRSMGDDLYRINMSFPLSIFCFELEPKKIH